MKKRILVFEDSDIFADVIIEYLTEQGFETDRAINGLDGIKKVYQFFPDLIITDVEMPLFKGYQAARLLKSRKTTQDIPIIMFTTLGETRDRFWGMQAGADYYVEKSVDNFKELKANIDLLLADRRDIDYEAIKKEEKKITDDYLIEMVNNLLDRKLFHATITSMLSELSASIKSLEETVEGAFQLLEYACEADAVTLLVKTGNNEVLSYTGNKAKYCREVLDDFAGLCMAGFHDAFPDYKIINEEKKEFQPPGKETKRLESYISFTLYSAGEDFATLHIANSIKEYFSPYIHENLSIFISSAAPILFNALLLRNMEELHVKTRAAFARYVPIDVMDEIIKKNASKGSVSESRNIVILFSDIRSFTTISENNDPQTVVNFLNRYFSKMGEKIKDEGGNIDKFIGDAIMAIFGAPKSYPDTPQRAIRAALNMVNELPSVPTEDIVLPSTGFRTGIGINYGECIVGNIGFQDKQDFTVIGDAVNLASRLEGVTKMYRHPLIVSESVYNATKDDFIFRKVDVVRVKGKDKPVGIYAVYAGYRDDEKTKDMVESIRADKGVLEAYDKGLRLFYMREWDGARQFFTEAVRMDGKDFLSRLYMKRIENFMKNPPSADWDGCMTLTEK